MGIAMIQSMLVPVEMKLILRTFLQGFVFLSLLHSSLSYVLTTPRKWSSNGESQVCVTTTKAQTPKSSVLSLTLKSDSKILIDQKPITFSHDGPGTVCNKVSVPLFQNSHAVLELKGSLDGEQVDYTKDISIVSPQKMGKTYVQTDKYLYKPLQTVNIRILTLFGPSLDVFDGKYSEIWIENPNRARLQQWLSVDGSAGLVHLAFDLSEEPTPGIYKVKVSSRFGEMGEAEFKIEDYVLPRYEVNLNPPAYILSSDNEATYEVCAKYTFGQPVKGIVNFKYQNDYYGNRRIEETLTKNISGCAPFTLKLGDTLITRRTYNLRASAEVIEEGTDTTLEAESVRTPISKTAVSFKDISLQKYAKPDLPYLAELKATFPDGSPAASEPMTVCLIDSKVCKNITSSQRGIVKFAVPPQSLQDSIEVKAVNYPRIEYPPSSSYRYSSVMYSSEYNLRLNMYNSPSDSSMIIGLTQRQIQCLPSADNLEFDLPIWFSSKGQTSALVTVQVISRGQILFAETQKQSFDSGNHLPISQDLYLEPPNQPADPDSHRGSFTVRVAVPKTASPKMKILVWYTRDDGEVVSVLRSVDVTECLLNDVSLKWSTDKAYPGHQSTLTISAKPLSLCSLGVVDKSVTLLQPEDQDITVSRLLKQVEEFDIQSHDQNQINDNDYCKKKFSTTSTTSTTTPVPHPTTPIIGPFDIEIDRPWAVEPPFIRPPVPQYEYYYTTSGTDTIHIFNDAGVYVLTNDQVEFRECERHKRPIYDWIMRRGGAPGGPILFAAPVPEMAFDGVAFNMHIPAAPGPPGAVVPTAVESTSEKARTYFPETWLWDLMPISDTGTHAQNLTLPDTVTEWVGKAVCVHPTEGVGVSGQSSITTFRDFFIDLTLPPSAKKGETFPLKISVFNYLNESIPVHIVLESSNEYEILSKSSPGLEPGEHMDCIDSQDKVVHSIPIRPIGETGDVNITVVAYIDVNSINNCTSKPLQQQWDSVIKPIRVDFEGFPKEEVFSDYICVSEDPANPDSEEGVAKWNIAAPSDIVQDSARGFLSVVGDLMGPTIENLGKLVRMPSGCGEQNMIGFAPNIFVMKYLEASGQGDKATTKNAIKFMESGYKRELNYRHKDGSYSAFGESDASGSTWLTAFVLKCFGQARPYIFVDPEQTTISANWLKNLQNPVGCFSKVGKILHKGMKGGVAKSDSEATLTSFVLISLLEAGTSPSESFVSDAISCIKADPSTDPYAMALKAYVLALAKDTDAASSLKELLGQYSHEAGVLKWNSEMSDALSLETSGYAVLALMEAGDVDTASKFIRSMNSKRNGQGGFISTQDTIVALQAMAAFERGLPQTATDLALIVSFTELHEPSSPKSPMTTSSSLKVDDTNKLLVQRTNIYNFPTEVEVIVSGSGCALIQTVLRYNVPKPDASEAFSMSVKAFTIPDTGCKTKGIRVCASYQLPDLASNMAIVEVDLMTGYIPDKTSLKSIIGGGSGTFKRYEVDGSKVSFYLDELTSQEACLDFKVLREFEVQDAKNGTVSLYDYYSPEFAISESYRFPDECFTVMNMDAMLPSS